MWPDIVKTPNTWFVDGYASKERTYEILDAIAGEFGHPSCILHLGYDHIADWALDHLVTSYYLPREVPEMFIAFNIVGYVIIENTEETFLRAERFRSVDVKIVEIVPTQERLS